MSISIDSIIQTVLSINSPLTANDERVRCTQMIETLKENSPDAIATVGFELVNKNDPLLSHVGWTFVEDVIRYKWNQLTSDYRFELRSRIFQLIEIQLNKNTIESNARCVVAMMEHEWPQNWGELVTQLEQLSTKSPLHCTVVFAIYRRVVENVVTLASIQVTQRRKDMYNALNAFMPELLVLALNSLDNCASDDTGLLATKYIICWLSDVCEWVTLTTLEPLMNRIIDTVVQYLNTAERNIYEQAALCLAALAGRKKERRDEGLIVSAFFRDQVISSILTTTSLAADVAHSSEEHYKYLKALCNLLTILGNHLARVWIDKTPPQNFSIYLSAIVAFFTHPSLHLKSEACDVLIALSTHTVFKDDPIFKAVISDVLGKVPLSMLKVGCPSKLPRTTATHYSLMDYDDDIEWHNTFLRFRSRIQILVSENITNHFLRLLSLFEECVFRPICADVKCGRHNCTHHKKICASFIY